MVRENFLFIPLIPRLDDGLDVSAAIAQSGSQLFDMRVYCAVVAFVFGAPDVVQDLTPREHDTFVLDEVEKEIVLFRCEGDNSALAGNAPFGRLDDEVVHDDHAVLDEESAVTVDERIDLEQQKLGRERLGDVLVRADLVAFFDVPVVAQSSQEDDGNVVLCADELAHFAPVLARHHDVQHDAVVAVHLDQAAGGLAVVSHIYLKAVLGKERYRDVS